MKYLSVCSGIEAATMAWHPLGWQPVAFAEIEKFPAAVLAHHYPSVPNWGDITKFKDWPDATVDLLVGGTPCQSFSVAGLRKGLADPRGNLALTYLAIADRYRPEWLVWENVPGVLSADDGRAFGAFLGGLVELGYGWAYRVLDAQYFGVAQRRRRVFVVASARGWQRAAAVLFDSESVSGNPPPRRETGKGVADGTISRALSRVGGGDDPGANKGAPLIPEVHPTLGASGAQRSTDLDNKTYILAFSVKDHGADAGDIAPTLRSGGHDGSHANGGVMPAVAFAQNSRDEVRLQGGDGQIVGALAAEPGMKQTTYVGCLTPELPQRVRIHGTDGTTPTLQSEEGRGHGVPTVFSSMQVRRLTPRECERLQGFPDDYSLIPYRGKPAADGPRYKALGNSMAVPCMAWIGTRIQLVVELTKEATDAA